jgi:hypothetical protein
MIRTLTLLFVFGVYFLSIASAQTKEDCLVCHEEGSLTALDTSAHSKLSCIACHRGVKPEPHETKPKKVNCGICHPTSLKSYKEGIHGKALE